ncbi:MAG: glycosyltransferase family 4 protein, partial [Clostridiales bacterium]|nr:glycosyltransferase family 4 protein [Clostridiales bacterium]
MHKKIWILNHYATNMFFDEGGRHYWFAHYLQKEGYEPTIICASTIHNSDKIVDTKNQNYIRVEKNGIPFVFVKTPPYKGNGKSRVMNMLSFYSRLFSSTKKYAEEYGKPDVILASSVHPLTLVAGIKIAKKFGVPCICEVRDLWPESLIAYGSLKRHSLLARLLYRGEKWIYKRADEIVFTVEGGKDYIKEREWDVESGGPIKLEKVHHINNGVDLDTYEINTKDNAVKDDDLTDCNTFKVIYTGSIREVNNIQVLVEAAKYIQDKSVEKIRFIIYGDGDKKDELVNWCESNNIE